MYWSCCPTRPGKPLTSAQQNATVGSDQYILPRHVSGGCRAPAVLSYLLWVVSRGSYVLSGDEWCHGDIDAKQAHKGQREHETLSSTDTSVRARVRTCQLFASNLERYLESDVAGLENAVDLELDTRKQNQHGQHRQHYPTLFTRAAHIRECRGYSADVMRSPSSRLLL